MITTYRDPVWPAARVDDCFVLSWQLINRGIVRLRGSPVVLVLSRLIKPDLDVLNPDFFKCKGTPIFMHPRVESEIEAAIIPKDQRVA